MAVPLVGRILAWQSVEHLSQVYADADAASVVCCAVFGFLWGVGSQLFGLGVDALGASLGFSIILGITACLGSIVPLVALHSDQILSLKGLCNFLSLALTVVGLTLVGWAGHEKDTATEPSAADLEEPLAASDSVKYESLPERPSVAKTSFGVGLSLCICSGVLSACLNFSVAFGADIKTQAQALGTSETLAGNAVAALGVSCGCVPNAVYCSSLLLRNGTWRECAQFGWRHQVVSVAALLVMAAMWFGGFAGYGVAVDLMGDLGTVVGWPLYINSMIVAANVAGVMAGEWTEAPQAAKTRMAMGLGALVAAVCVVGYGNLK